VRKKGISAIMAIHDLNLAARYADTIVMMNGGSISSVGNPTSVLTQENIKQVYGVEAEVNHKNGKLFVVPLRAVRKTD
jgi:iron complex transport system ATP-binding protein